VQRGVGEGVEDPVAVAAAEVQDRWTAAAMDSHTVALVTARAGESVGVQPLDEYGVAGVLIQQLG
jgi:hypothetical protein